jgi:hypothetical protein
MTMIRLSALGSRFSALAGLALFAGSAGAQQQAAASHASHGAAGIPQLPRDEIVSLARVQVAIIAARDSINVQRAKSGNKTGQAQQQLMDKLRTHVADILQQGGLTEPEYQRRTFVISSDTTSRRIFDSVVVAVTGAPLPGYAARAAIVAVPAGPVGVHLGHVVNNFNETPSLQGLLPAAIAEARIAIAHATLAGRQPTNLEYMKTHAGHVIHAIDPTIITMGPGLGYGVKKASNGVATHIELAAAAEGAAPGVVMHSKHVATAVRTVVTRADQVLALAQKVQAATSPQEAAALVSQMTSAAEQLMAGSDVNGDGRITWEQGEGGLQHADDHVKLLLSAAM